MIDTHTHLTDEPLISKLPKVLENARIAGVTKLIIPGYDKNSWENARKLSEKFDNVFFAVGLHPMFTSDYSVEKLEKELELKNAIAIGEIGLDYTPENVDCNRQKLLFEFQMSVAEKYNLPVIIHCRKAYDDLLEILKKFPNVRGVLHSCSCSCEQIKPFLELGYYVSFSGVVTRKRTKKNKKLAEFVPLDRILSETDSPFIGTENFPAFSSEPFCVKEVISALAVIKKIDFEEMEKITTNNAEKLFGIKLN